MSSSRALLCFLLSFIGGIFIASFFNIPRFLIYEFFGLGIFYAIVFSKEKEIVVFAFCLLFFGGGMLRLQTADVNPKGGGNLSQQPLEQKIERAFSPLKQKLRSFVYQDFSPPRSSILAALVLGDKKRISRQWKAKLNAAGLRHLTAVSGMHIIILSFLLTNLFVFLGLSRLRSFYFVIFTLWFFIALIGFQPSAVRAGIMGSIFLFCQKLGRPRAGPQALLIAAGLMLLFNPLILRGSIGFQLSFLATLGLMYLLPVLNNWLARIKLLERLGLSYLLAVTFSAQIFVLPLLIYNFGYFSLVSPLTNIIAVPVLPFLMGFGLLFLFLGLIYQPLGFLVYLLLWPLLGYLIFVIDFFSGLPLAKVNLHASWLFIPIYYSFLFSFLYSYLRKRKRETLIP